MSNHPDGPRPLTFFYKNDNTPLPDMKQIAEFTRLQFVWDLKFKKMSLIKRILSRLSGEVTEPLGTRGGLPFKFKTIDGGYICPFPGMTDYDLREFENDNDFGVDDRTFKSTR